MAFYYGGKYADQLKEIDSLDNYGKVSYLNLALESKGWQWWNLKKTNFIDLFEKYIIRKLKSTHLTLKEKTDETYAFIVYKKGLFSHKKGFRVNFL